MLALSAARAGLRPARLHPPVALEGCAEVPERGRLEEGGAEVKLWLIVTYLNHVIASVGPLPYGMEECQSRAEALRNDGSLDVRSGAELDGRRVEPKDIAVECRFLDARPQDGEALQ
jgi:hypothetical protein